MATSSGFFYDLGVDESLDFTISLLELYPCGTLTTLWEWEFNFFFINKSGWMMKGDKFVIMIEIKQREKDCFLKTETT